MKEFDEYGLKLCKYQAGVFSLSREKVECSSPVFLRRFMYSDVARRMDGQGFLFEAISPEGVIEEINQQFGVSDYGKVKYGNEELYWIGYLYRYWCYTREISSKKVYSVIKPAELKKLYYPYHSLDPSQVIERIREAKGIGEEDYIQKGVKILRALREEQRQYASEHLDEAIESDPK